MFRFVFIIIFIFSCHSWAQWKLEHRELWLNSQSKYSEQFHSAAATTFWGAYHRLLDWPFAKGQMHELSHPLITNGKLPVYISKRDAKAKLIVFFPGIFGQANRHMTGRLVRRLEDMNFHVMVLPNVLASQYIRLLPDYSKGVFSTEVELMNFALEFAKKQIGQKISEVHVMAESLGTITASAWYGQNAELVSLTLLWPPLNLYQAMKNFDQIIQEHQNYSCSNLWTMAKVIYRFSIVPQNQALDPEFEKCVGQMALVQGFQEQTQKVFLEYSKVVPEKNKIQPKGFEDFILNYQKPLADLIVNQSEQLKLNYWLQKKQLKRKKIDIKILSSQNDFLNQNQSWDVFLKKTELPQESLILLNWGGHSGPVATEEFWQTLRMIY